MTSLILNVTIHPASHSHPMETSECLVFGKICACLAVFGSIVKYNSPSIVDLVIYLLGHIASIISVIGCTLFRWADTAMKLPVHTESATAEFSYFIYFQILLLALERD